MCDKLNNGPSKMPLSLIPITYKCVSLQWDWLRSYGRGLLESNGVEQRETKKQVLKVFVLICMEMQSPVSKAFERYPGFSEKDKHIQHRKAVLNICKSQKMKCHFISVSSSKNVPGSLFSALSTHIFLPLDPTSSTRNHF